MKIIEVNLKEKKYKIIIGWNILNRIGDQLKLLKIPANLFVITNHYVASLYFHTLKKTLKQAGFFPKLYITNDTEKAKSSISMLGLIDKMADYGKDKKIAVLALGGGVVGDLAGFTASIYKRGVPLIHVPTTLLAQTDSSIGGKTAIDLKIAKNLIGTFYQPKLVFAELSFLKSLDKKQMRAGLAETIKYAIIKDGGLFEFLEDTYNSIFSCEPKALENLIYRCAKIKAEIVSLDEKEEKGLRVVLNYGHTIGHAIEVAGGYVKYSHGQAISIGMLCAAKISQRMKIMTEDTYQRIANLIVRIGLPQEVQGIKEADVLNAYKLDKKFIGKTNRFVLIKNIGKPVVYENIPEKIISGALKELFVN